METPRRGLLLRSLPLVGFLAALTLVVAFAAFPTPILGTDGDSLGRAVNESILAGDTPCKEAEDGWDCWVLNPGSSSSSQRFRVEVDRWGCWTATPIRAPDRRGRTGCVNILDHLSLL